MSFSFFCCCWKLSLHISNFPQTLHLPLKCYLLLRHLQLIEKTMEMVGNGIRQLMICYTEKGCTWTLSLHPTHKLRRFASHIKLWAQFLRWHELGVVTPCSTWEGEGGDSVVQSLQPHSQFKCETSLVGVALWGQGRRFTGIRNGGVQDRSVVGCLPSTPSSGTSS